MNILTLVLYSGFTGTLLSAYNIISTLLDKKCKLIKLSPMGDCTQTFLLPYSIDDVTALRAKLWQGLPTHKNTSWRNVKIHKSCQNHSLGLHGNLVT